MSQAQIAGGKINSAEQYPSRGYRLRDFTLPALHGKRVSPSDFRGRSNLVLLFAGRADASCPLLSELWTRYSEINEEYAVMIVVVQGRKDEVLHFAQAVSPPFPVLFDEYGHVHCDFGAADSHGRPAPALYITDRYGEVFGAYRTAAGQPLPTVKEVLNWLEFVNSQCPECEPPEWPLP